MGPASLLFIPSIYDPKDNGLDLKLHAILRMSVPYAFIILSAISTVYLVASAINYLSFYPALNELESNISTVTLTTVVMNSSGTLLANVTVTNPSDYSGLTVANMFLSTFFLPSNMSNSPLFNETRLTGTASYFIPLPPRTSINLDITTHLTPGMVSSVSRYLSVNSNMITASCLLDVYVSTFLDKDLGYVTLPEQQRNIPLTLTT